MRVKRGLGVLGAAAAAVIVAAAALLLGAQGGWLPRPAREKVEVKLPPPPAGALAPLDPALAEATSDGPLPRVGADGRLPWQVYARPFPAAERRPLVAIVVTGLGLDAAAAQAAADRLPAPVTLAFSPYAQNLPALIGAARRAGHEVMLGLPMEPADFPRQDPGPETLLTSLDPPENLARLRWTMSRGGAYVGLAAIMGERFTAAKANLAPVLDAIKARGLLFVDGASPDSVSGELARQIGLAWSHADRAIGGETDPAAIDAALAALETAAIKTGASLGMATFEPELADKIAAWAPTLPGKGLVLAPATAVAAREAHPTKASP